MPERMDKCQHNKVEARNWLSPRTKHTGVIHKIRTHAQMAATHMC